MKKNTLYLLISCCLLLMASRSYAASLFVNCPLREAETSVTTRIASPWWTTPYLGRQVDVEVRNVGGRQTLSCLYEAGGGEVAVVRRFPPGYTSCRAGREGFRCSRGGTSLGIKCPEGLVQTDVTSPVQPPWWTTPVAGRLQDVAVMDIAGQPALACIYQGRSSPRVSVMREYPPGYDRCRTEGNGFRCDGSGELKAGSVSREHRQTVIKDNSVSVGNVKKQHDQVLKSKGDKGSATAKYGAGSVCTDLRISKIQVSDITRQPDNRFSFTLYGYLENSSGHDWMSGEGQQRVHIYESKRLAREVPFEIMRDGSSNGLYLDVQDWQLNDPRSPDYSYRIVFDPDTRTDDNSMNDDCRSGNDYKHISRQEIDRIIRASGK